MILPFGKYAGHTLGETESANQQYLFWLVAQRRWLKRDHPEIYRAARNRVMTILREEIEGEVVRARPHTPGVPFEFVQVKELLG